jgi:hypothetical protein
LPKKAALYTMKVPSEQRLTRPESRSQALHYGHDQDS